MLDVPHMNSTFGDRSYIHYLQATYPEQSAACYLGSIAILQQIQDTPQDSLCDCYGASVFELAPY